VTRSLQQSWRNDDSKFIPTRPYVKREIIEKSLSVSKNAAAGGAEPEKFYDNSFVKSLDDAGFLKALFGGP
jgi:hypothetical protein